MIDLESQIKAVLKAEKRKYFPYCFTEEDIEVLSVENFIAWVSDKGLIQGFIKLDEEDEGLKVDFFWIDRKHLRKGLLFLYGVINNLFKYSAKVFTHTFVGRRNSLIKVGKIVEQRFITCYRFNSPVFNLQALQNMGIEFNGLFAYVEYDRPSGYSRFIYELFTTTGVPFVILDLPYPPLGRKFDAYYLININKEKIERKIQALKEKEHLSFDGHIIPLNLNLVGKEITKI
jgi:hypothetical protein